MRMPAMPGASHPLSAACTKAPSSGAQSAGRTPLASRAGPAAVRSARKFHTKRATPATARASGSASSPATGRRMPTYAGVAGSAGSAVSARASGHASPGSPRSRHCASMPTVLLTAAASTCTAPGRERARAGARSARRPGARQQAPGRGGAARGPRTCSAGAPAPDASACSARAVVAAAAAMLSSSTDDALSNRLW